MYDYYGRELNIGDLVLCLPTSQNDFHYSDDRVTLLVGKKEVFRLYRKKYSIYNISNEILIKLSPVNTDKLLEKYTKLKNEYDKYMQQDIKSNQMSSNLEPGDIVVRNNKSKQSFVYVGYGDFIAKYNNQIESNRGYLYISLSVFGHVSGLRMIPKNINGYEFSLEKAISYLYSTINWYNDVDRSKLIFSKSPLMIKEIKGKLKLSSSDAKYVCDKNTYIKSVEFKNKT